MHILHVLAAPAAGGAEVYVKDLAKALVKDKHKVSLGFLGRARDIGRSETYESRFLEELEDAGVNWFFIGNECRKKPWLGMRRIKKFALSEGVEVYHSHLPYGVAFSAGIGIPTVYTHHSIKPRLNWLTYRIFNCLIDRYVGISGACTEMLESYCGRKVTPILNGVDFSKFHGSKRSASSDGGMLTAIAVGRIHPHKGYYFLGKIIKALPERLRSRIRIRIAGEGDSHYTNELKHYLVTAGIADNFEFLGNRLDIPELLSGSDLFLLASEQEGLPISLIEACAAALPCIVTDVGGCKEIIELCKNGAAVPYGDVKSYARILGEVLEDSGTLRAWSVNARNNRSALSIDKAAERHLELYNEVFRG